nr:UvrD-helicase domain-containing protein [Corynebacterium lactis]
MNAVDAANKENAAAVSLADRGARADIVTDLSSSFFVEAGAGSGKTASLVRRLVNLILVEGVDIESIAAITFTESAANELRERLRHVLTEIAREGTYKFPGEESIDYSDHQERCGEALAKLPGAAIGTLHSFAMRILQMFPLEAGLPPELSAASDEVYSTASAEAGAFCATVLAGVLEGDEEAGAIITEALQAEGHDFLADFSLDELAESIDYLIRNGMSSKNFEETLVWMDKHWGELQPTLDEKIPARGGLDRETLEGYIRELDIIVEPCSKPGDKLLVAIQSNIGMLRALLEKGPSSEGITEGLFELDFEVKVSSRIGVAGNWGGNEGKANALESFGAVASELTGSSARPIHRALAVLRRAMAALILREATMRVRSGVLEFHDMIFLADKLIKHEDVVAALGRKFRHVFVDEFQDTDPVQYRLVTAITRGGTLFTVGDPKQSIYRFRRADVNSYLAARDEADEDRVRKLNTNFRSSRGVLEPLNTLFEKLFDGGEVDFTRLEAGNASEGAAYFIEHEFVDPDSAAEATEEPVDLDNGPAFDGSGLIKQFQRIEFGDILAAIREAESGRWAKDDGEPIGLGDIAILAPTNKIAMETMELLRSRNIAFVSEGALKLFATPEIVDIISVIRAVSDPADEFAQVAALRSAALGCSDTDLVKDRLERGSAGKVEEARALLTQWRADSRQLSIGDLVAKMLCDIDAQINVIAWKRPEALTRLRAFEAACRNYSDSAGSNLRAFVLWAEDNADESNRNAIADPVLDTDTDGVRVMTMHASKGREFPMVIVAGMSSRSSTKGKQQLFAPGSNVIELSLGHGLTTSGYKTATDADKEAEAHEDIRLNYVAMTRAKNVLVVPLQVEFSLASDKNKRGKPQKSSRGFYILQSLQELQESQSGLLCHRSQAFPAGAPRIDEVTETDVDKRSYARGLDEIRADMNATAEAVQEAGRRVTRVAATAVAHYEAVEAEPLADAALGEIGAPAADLSPTAADETLLLRSSLLPDGWIDVDGLEPLRTKPATEKARGNVFGTAVHAVMEHLNTDGGNLEQACLDAVTAEGLDRELLGDVEASARSLAGSSVFRSFGDATRVRRVWRELPIIGQVCLDNAEPITVEGVIDVLYETAAGELVIADYKTDFAVSQQTMAEYFGQLKIYAQMLDAPVARLELIFAREAEAEVRTLEL